MFDDLSINVIASILAFYMTIQELVLYKKTKQIYHKIYSIFFISISMVFIPLIILRIIHYPNSISGIVLGTISVLFAVVAFFLYFHAEKSRKNHNKNRNK